MGRDQDRDNEGGEVTTSDSCMWCRDCGRLMWRSESHRCPPFWLVWQPEQGETRDDARRVGGDDAEEAAHRFCEFQDNQGDGPCMDDRHLMVALDADGSGADPWVVVTRPTVEYETFQERKS